jgi:hypothetical protein
MVLALRPGDILEYFGTKEEGDAGDSNQGREPTIQNGRSTFVSVSIPDAPNSLPLRRDD